MLSEFVHSLFAVFVYIISEWDYSTERSPPAQSGYVVQPGHFRPADLPRPAENINGQFGLHCTCTVV